MARLVAGLKSAVFLHMTSAALHPGEITLSQPLIAEGFSL
jgi:hypothetical protein